MAWSKKFMIERALQEIRSQSLFFITDLFAYVPFGQSAFYEKQLHRDPQIVAALEKNRITTRQSLRAKWYQSTNPTVQIALYKLICSEDDLDRLTNQNIKVKDISNGFETHSKQEIEESLKNLYTDE